MTKTVDFLAKELKARRKRAGLSQDELSEKTGVSMAQISEIERGIANPTLSILEKIADYFQITVAELLDKNDVLNNNEALKKSITENVEHMSTQQLRIMMSLIRIAQSK